MKYNLKVCDRYRWKFTWWQVHDWTGKKMLYQRESHEIYSNVLHNEGWILINVKSKTLDYLLEGTDFHL